MYKAYEIALAPEFVSTLALEAFIMTNDIPKGDKKDRVLIMATELFDNIVRHSRDLAGEISFRLEEDVPLREGVPFSEGESGCRLIISYKSSNFEELMACSRCSARYYDQKLGLYRGLGLVMCRNLARDMVFEPGSEADRIIVSL
ncbi:MAG: hypothetical protein LBU99_04340 [Spirochaetaceae bacterium]|jgi:hypothetical protein|nr:hypothetical protein [Spirochaetaceae bacterium]